MTAASGRQRFQWSNFSGHFQWFDELAHFEYHAKVAGIVLDEFFIDQNDIGLVEGNEEIENDLEDEAEDGDEDDPLNSSQGFHALQEKFTKFFMVRVLTGPKQIFKFCYDQGFHATEESA